jgi:hypothetical protein
MAMRFIDRPIVGGFVAKQTACPVPREQNAAVNGKKWPKSHSGRVPPGLSPGRESLRSHDFRDLNAALFMSES